MITFSNNNELDTFVSQMDTNETYFGIVAEAKVMLFKTKRAFNKVAKKHHNAVQGDFNVYNCIWYRFF